MPPAAARAVTRGRFRVTQEDAAASPAPRDGADDQRVLRGLQHQNTMVLARLAELEKAVRSQHRGGDEPPREAPKGAGANLEDLDASAATRPLRRAHDLATELRDALAAARTRAGEHESMLKLLKQKHASLAAKLEAGQADAARLRRENEALRRDRDRFKRELDDERARHQARAAAAPPPPAAPASRAPVPAPAVVARRAAADREFAAIAAQAAQPTAPPAPVATPPLAAPGAPGPPQPPPMGQAPPSAPPPHFQPPPMGQAPPSAPPPHFGAPPPPPMGHAQPPAPPAVAAAAPAGAGAPPGPPGAAPPRTPSFDSLAPPAHPGHPGHAVPAPRAAPYQPPPLAMAPPPPAAAPPRDASAADVLGAFVVPEPAAPPAAEPFCPARHAAEEDEFGAIAGRTAIR